MADTPRLRDVDRLIAQRTRAEDKVINTWMKDLRDRVNQIVEKAERASQRLDTDFRGKVKNTNKNNQRVQKIAMAVEREVELAINASIRGLTRDTAKLKSFYERELDQISSPSRTISASRSASLISSVGARAALATNLEPMRPLGDNFVTAMRRELESSLFEDIGPREIAKRVQGFISGGNLTTKQLEARSRTLAETAYNAHASAITLAGAPVDDIVGYRYSGPRDRKNRAFCGIRVGLVLPKDDLEGDIESQPGGTLHNPGGFRCRHKLFPIFIDDPEAEDLIAEGEAAQQGRRTSGPGVSGGTGQANSQKFYSSQIGRSKLSQGQKRTVTQPEDLFRQRGNPLNLDDPMSDPRIQDTVNALRAVAQKSTPSIVGGVIDDSGKIVQGKIVKGGKGFVNTDGVNSIANKAKPKGKISVRTSADGEGFSPSDARAFAEDLRNFGISRSVIFGDNDNFFEVRLNGRFSADDADFLASDLNKRYNEERERLSRQVQNGDITEAEAVSAFSRRTSDLFNESVSFYNSRLGDDAVDRGIAFRSVISGED